jgi:3-oxoacyl-[acyl-carrier-protein] synthase III
MKALAVQISGLGTALPATVVASSRLEAEWGLASGWIERHTGVSERRWAIDETAPQLGAAAARQALAQAQLTLADIDCLISASASVYQAIPCTAVFIAQELGISDGQWACFDVNATCLSFVLAVEQASHLISAGVYRRVLIVSSEKSRFSLNSQHNESAALIGDAAAAVVVEPSQNTASFLGARLRSYPSGIAMTEFRGGGTRQHPLDPTTTASDNQFSMDGPAIFRFATRQMEPFLRQFLADIGWSIGDVDLLVPHQASLPAIRLLSARLGFSEAQTFINIGKRGNCIGASLPLALAEAAASGRLQRGMRVLLAGTAAGLTIGAVALVF